MIIDNKLKEELDEYRNSLDPVINNNVIEDSFIDDTDKIVSFLKNVIDDKKNEDRELVDIISWFKDNNRLDDLKNDLRIIKKNYSNKFLYEIVQGSFNTHVQELIDNYKAKKVDVNVGSENIKIDRNNSKYYFSNPEYKKEFEDIMSGDLPDKFKFDIVYKLLEKDYFESTSGENVLTKREQWDAPQHLTEVDDDYTPERIAEMNKNIIKNLG